MSKSTTTLRLGVMLSAVILLLAFAGYAANAGGKAAFKVEITNESGVPLSSGEHFGMAGIEQTLLAQVVPAIEGAEYEWTISAPAIRTYEHDVQRAERHRPIPLSTKDRAGRKFSFFWTRPQDSTKVSVVVRKGDDRAVAEATFHVRLPRDASRDIYAFADNDRRRNPNGLSATYAIARSHRNWHIGLTMSNGDRPVFADNDLLPKAAWGDFGYRNDPSRMWGQDYNGSAFLRWHNAILQAQAAWRRTFHVRDLETAPPTALLFPEFFRRVPDVKSSASSRLFGYVRLGEFQDVDQLGKEVVHPWHNLGHVHTARRTHERRMDDHSISPTSRDDLFWRWHGVVEEVHRSFSSDQAVVTTVYPENGAVVEDASAIFVAFDRKVSTNAPAVNKAQFMAAHLTVNGKPAKVVADASSEDAPCTMFRLSGFAEPTGAVSVALTGTSSFKGTSWTFTVKNGAKQAPAAAAPSEFRKRALAAFQAAQAKQRKDDIKHAVAALAAPDADDIWIAYLFKTYPLTVEEGMPILIKLLEHPSEHVVAHAVQTMQYRYGPQAKAAIPKLTELIYDKSERLWWVKERFAHALGVIGGGKPEVMSALISSIRSKKSAEPVNHGSIESLGLIGPPAGEALPLLRKLLGSADPETAYAAYRAIGKIVKSERPTLGELKKMEAVDWLAADGGHAVFSTIQQHGPAAAFAVPLLVETFRRQAPLHVKAVVLETLGEVEAGDAAAVQLMLGALPARWGAPGDPPGEKFLSDRGSDALARLKPTDLRAVPILAGALAHADPKVREQAAVALSKYGPEARPAVPALVAALKESDSRTDPHQLGAYLDALRSIGPGAHDAAGTLVELLSERSPWYRNQEKFWAHYLQAYLLATLADIGVPTTARPYILDYLNNSDKTMMHGYAAAARAAGTLGPRMPEAVPGLLRSLQPNFPDVGMSFSHFSVAMGAADVSGRLEALRALAKIGPQAKEAIPSVARLIKERPTVEMNMPPWHEEAARTLQAIGGK